MSRSLVRESFRRAAWPAVAAVIPLLFVVFLLPRAGPTHASESSDWDGGKLTKSVNADVENNNVTITVDYTKKTMNHVETGKLIRFIEMIGAKGVAYESRIIIGGGHKKIPAADASGKVVWKVTKDDIPNMRQGQVRRGPDGKICSSCHDENNMPALQEWPNGADFNQVTDQEFKDWVQGIKDNGWEEYTDINAQDPGDENTDLAAKTECIQGAVSAVAESPSDFHFFHLNRGPTGFYSLQIDHAVIPPGWEAFTNPPLGQLYFLMENEGLYGTITIIPHGVLPEGEQARVRLCTIDQATGECPEAFNVRTVVDHEPPIVLRGPSGIILPDAHILLSVTAQDLPATVAGAKLFYTLNAAPERSGYMDITSSSEDPVEFALRIGGLVAGDNILTYYIVIADELGNTTKTDVQTQQFTLEGSPAGAVPDGSDVPGSPLRLGKDAAIGMTLDWDLSCVDTDRDYAIYEGALGAFTSHVAATCSTNGFTDYTLPLSTGNHYYLVVPHNGQFEGSYGRSSTGERPPSSASCYAAFVGENLCP